jgi:multidrug efflux system membrane fusion protein
MPTQAFTPRRIALAAGSLVAVAALVAGGVAIRKSNAAPSPAAKATPVAVASVVASEVALWDEFSGRLEAVERVDVRSRVAGAVYATHFTEGSLVRKGDLLVTIDPAPYAAEVDRARAQLAAAQARLTNAKSERERAERLWNESAISRREVDERVNALRESEANVQAADAALQSARLNLGYTEVRAPVSGRVGKLEVTQGNLVASGPGAAVLTTLVSVNPIYASFDADEQVVSRALRDAGSKISTIPVGMKTAVDGEERAGHLQLVDNQVNAKSGTVRVRAVFDNKDGELMPGQFAHVRLGRPKAIPAVLINDRAVGTDQNKKFVMVVGPDNKAAYREVTLGGSAQGLRIVSAGLERGERIVVNGLQRVRPGTLVDPQPAEMAIKPRDEKVASR